MVHQILLACPDPKKVKSIHWIIKNAQLHAHGVVHFYPLSGFCLLPVMTRAVPDFPPLSRDLEFGFALVSARPYTGFPVGAASVSAIPSISCSLPQRRSRSI